MSSGTVASWGLWIEFEIIWKILSSISALSAIVLPILAWTKMTEKMVGLKQKWTLSKMDYEMLWIRMNQGQDMAKSEKEFVRIRKNETIVSQRESKLSYNRKLLYKCRDEVLKSQGLP